MQRSSKIILSLIALALIIFAIIKLLSPNPLSDEQQVVNQLTSAAEAASEKNAQGVMSIVSTSYQDSNGDNPLQLNILLRRGFQDAGNVTVTLSTINVTVNGDTAKSTCYMKVVADGSTEFNQLIDLDWHKETTHRYLVFPEQVWRVEHSNFVGSLPDGV